MKRIIIIEDESVAAEHLQRALHEVLPQAEVVCVLQSIEESVEYFRQVEATPSCPDLIFMDIHLADGLAFRIFDQVKVPYPIVFTTAYDQYALDAFRQGGVDYLLKPISKDDLRRTVEKMRRIASATEPVPVADYVALGQHLKRYRSHFLIPMRDKLIPIDVHRIAYICVSDKLARIVTDSDEHFTLDSPLDALTEQLDPSLFFRANRQYVVSRTAIAEIAVWPISKLSLSLTVPTPERIIISKARAAEFKQWYVQ